MHTAISHKGATELSSDFKVDTDVKNWKMNLMFLFIFHQQLTRFNFCKKHQKLLLIAVLTMYAVHIFYFVAIKETMRNYGRFPKILQFFWDYTAPNQPFSMIFSPSEAE